MNCPRDGNPLFQSSIEGSEIDRCETCGGMFLSRGTLNRIAEPTEGDIEFSTIDLDSFQHADNYPPATCPKNPDVQMVKVEFLIDTNIILDFCGTCHGFWLDGRELTRINEEVSELNAAARDIADPPLVRLSNFFWNLPFPH